IDASTQSDEHPCRVVYGPDGDILPGGVCTFHKLTRSHAHLHRKEVRLELGQITDCLCHQQPHSPGRTQGFHFAHHIPIERHEEAVALHAGVLDKRGDTFFQVRIMTVRFEFDNDTATSLAG